MSEFAVELQDVVKRFPTPEGGEVIAVNHVTMQIKNGEFFSMLGSSGCGKTTSLRMVAGFEWPTSGEVYIEGVAQEHTPPFKRPVNTVFQNYALFHHMTVFQNVAFGLEMDGAGKDEIKKRAGHHQLGGSIQTRLFHQLFFRGLDFFRELAPRDNRIFQIGFESGFDGDDLLCFFIQVGCFVFLLEFLQVQAC